MVKWKYIGSLLRLYIYIHVQNVKTNNWIVHEYECLFLAFILLQIERESGKQNLGVKEKCPNVTYLIFDGVPLENFLLSRANRLCSVFSTGLKDFGVPRVSVNLLSLARSKMAMVRLPRALLKNYLFCALLPLRGREPHFRLGSPPIIWLLSLSPSDVRRPEFTKCEHLVYLLCDPHSLLTVTFWLLDTLIQYGRIVSVLPLRLREPSRDSM